MSDPEVWSVTDHICAHCLGRLLVQRGSGRGLLYRCAECGAVGAGQRGVSHPPMCVCGSKIGERNAGIRCVVNEDQSTDRPWEVVAREVKTGREVKKGMHRRLCDLTEELLRDVEI